MVVCICQFQSQNILKLSTHFLETVSSHAPVSNERLHGEGTKSIQKGNVLIPRLVFMIS